MRERARKWLATFRSRRRNKERCQQREQGQQVQRTRQVRRRPCGRCSTQSRPRYDLLNHVLSANVDRLWWRRAARRFNDVLARPEAAILDICCGTGDLTMALLKRRPKGATPILAADFSPAMLRRGAGKFGLKKSSGSANGAPYAVAIEADALHLPLRTESLDLIVTAFGFRNLANYEAGLGSFIAC